MGGVIIELLSVLILEYQQRRQQAWRNGYSSAEISGEELMARISYFINNDFCEAPFQYSIPLNRIKILDKPLV